MKDIVVIGAGIVGLACSRELLLRQPGLRLAVLEKEAQVGLHQTSHNSGVLHSGVYYAPGSLRARLCVQGAAELYTYCDSKGIQAERCGKVIVAATSSEQPRLHALLERGRANGVDGLQLLGPERLREIEPHCVGVEALWSPQTGITDFQLVARSLSDDVLSLGGDVLTGHAVSAFRYRSDGVVLETSEGDVEARYVLTCAGLFSDRIARLSGASPEPAIIPFRGRYWRLKPARRRLIQNLIYPVPDPAFPFLGVHFTRRLPDGDIWLGPNAVLALSREGYRRSNVRIGDVRQIAAHAGFRRMARRYWRVGLSELYRDSRKSVLVNSLRKYVPEIVATDLVPGPSGVRAQAIGPNGGLIEDFVLEVHNDRVLHLRNAPSPAATSCLAIARVIGDRLAALMA